MVGIIQVFTDPWVQRVEVHGIMRLSVSLLPIGNVFMFREAHVLSVSSNKVVYLEIGSWEVVLFIGKACL